MKTIKKWLLPYKQALPALLLYQIIATVASAAWLALFKWIAGLLIRGTGKVAISSGDFVFLFKTWQGYVIILLAILTLFLLVAIDINPLVILCGRILKGEKPNVLLCFKEGFVLLKRFFTPGGFVVVLYLSLLAPILGFGVSISLTQNLYIPKFITSVIYSTPLYLIGVLVVFALLLLLGLVYMFILHGTLLGGMKMKDSARNSAHLFKKNWKNLIKSIIVFVLLYAVVAGLLLGLLALLMWIRKLIAMPANVDLIVSLVLMLIIIFPLVYIIALFTPNYVLKLTMLYNRYMNEGEWEYQKREPRKSPLVIANVVIVVLAIVGLTASVAAFGEELFPSEIKTGYIAHRAGGNEAPENTVAGVEAAYQLGASGSEIDIQRTSDGYYVVNHDADFNRTCGVAKKPSEMTLAEVKELKVDGEPVATFEEMLDASHGKVILYVELKGETADQQMADDAVRIIKERGMEKETVLISLNYDLIDYISTNYPDMDTGYLTFVSFGDTASLNCDYLALEEETSTESMINSIHSKGKKVFVWTVNDDEDLYQFLGGNADEIITDNVSGAKETKALLESRSLFDRMTDTVLDMFFG